MAFHRLNRACEPTAMFAVWNCTAKEKNRVFLDCINDTIVGQIAVGFLGRYDVFVGTFSLRNAHLELFAQCFVPVMTEDGTTVASHFANFCEACLLSLR